MKTNKAIMQLNVIIDETAKVEMGPSTIESIPVKTQIAILKLLDKVGDNINKILEKDVLPPAEETEAFARLHADGEEPQDPTSDGLVQE